MCRASGGHEMILFLSSDGVFRWRRRNWFGKDHLAAYKVSIMVRAWSFGVVLEDLRERSI